MNKLYNEKLMYKMGICMLLVGVVYNLLRAYGKVSGYDKVINIVLSLSLAYVIGRDFYLPFLGDAVIPTGALEEDKTPLGANIETVVKVPPNRTVMYWAAEPSNSSNKMPWEAYKKYDNSGVTVSNSKGEATLRVRSPQAYKTPWGKQLKPHIHYRFSRTNGMYSRIETVYV